MKRPIDPKTLGLKEPNKFIQNKERAFIDLVPDSKIRLQTLVDAWNKIVKDLPENHNLIDGPYVKEISQYGNPHIEYTVEIENPYFENDKANYDRQVSIYLKAQKAFDIEQEKKSSSKALSIEDQIVWAEAHLAELKAKKEELCCG